MTTVKQAADAVARDLVANYRKALNAVAEYRGIRPQDVLGDADAEGAVLVAAMALIAGGPAAAKLTETLAPRKCQRSGCPNEATRREFKGPWYPVWCSSACRTWARRMGWRIERRGARRNVEKGARNVLLCAHCGAETECAGPQRHRKYCSDRCRMAAYKARKRAALAPANA